MKNFFKVSLIALLAVGGFACTDDDELNESQRPKTAPTVEVGEVTLCDDEQSATVEVIPSENTEELHWACVEEDGVEYENGKITNEKDTLKLPGIKLDTNYTLTVYTKNSVGKSEQVVRQFIFKKEDILKELVEIKVVNTTVVTMDIDVVKSAKCSKYVIGGIKKLGANDKDGNPTILYTDDSFKDQAESSVAAYDEYAKGASGETYLMKPAFVMATQSGRYGEYNLRKNRNLSTDPNGFDGLPVESGETYVVAVYAYDAEGNATLYKEEVTLPTSSPVAGTVDIAIKVNNPTTAYNSVDVTITAGSGCRRLFYGISSPTGWSSTGGGQDMRKMSNAEFEKCVMSLTLGQATIYDGPINDVLKDNINPGSERVIWAIGIDENGNIGKIDRVFFTAPAYKANGNGAITSVTLAETSDKTALQIDLAVNSSTKKVRIIDGRKADIEEQMKNLDYFFYLSKADGSSWREFDVTDGKVSATLDFLPIYGSYNTQYFFAAAVDANGNLSKNVNLVKAYDSSKEAWPIPTAEPESKMTFDGTGEMTITLAKETYTEPSDFSNGGWKANFNVTKGANTVALRFITIANGLVSDIESTLKDDYSDGILPTGSMFYKKFADDTSTIYWYNKLFSNAYDESKGGGIGVFISEDTNGKYKIVAYYTAGSGKITTYTK